MAAKRDRLPQERPDLRVCARVAGLALGLSCVILGACDIPSEDAIADRASAECKAVVQESLATCTQDAWQLCDAAYQRVLDDMTSQVDALRLQLQQVSGQKAAEWLSASGCEWLPATHVWLCPDVEGSVLCQK